MQSLDLVNWAPALNLSLQGSLHFILPFTQEFAVWFLGLIGTSSAIWVRYPEFELGPVGLSLITLLQGTVTLPCVWGQPAVLEEF